MDNSTSDFEEAASLDNALLESLFYDEMMLMDDEGATSLLLSSHPSSIAASAETIAEKALLRDFGVTSLPVLSARGSHRLREPSSGSTGQPALGLLLAPELQANSSLTISTLSEREMMLQDQDDQYSPVATRQAEPTEAISFLETNPGGATTLVRRVKLISQFTTLASRLGIDLPPEVVQSLATNAVNTNELSGNFRNSLSDTWLSDDRRDGVVTNSVTSIPSAKTISFPSLETYLLAAKDEPAQASPSSSSLPSTVQELQQTAEAAIAAVSRKRSSADLAGDAHHHKDSSSGISRDGTFSGTSSDNNRPRRRKKPRLGDCESRLAELKAENELLTRHLSIVTNQSVKQDLERAQAEQRMRNLLSDKGATDQEADALVMNFTEMYSDYGRRRHQELSFHLEQLQRLANPTNFTKMGLWTLGQQTNNPKRNPIAGMLQKELGITPQQGRKILENREKIRKVSSNIKECLALLAKLKSLCERKTKIFHDRLSKCREILTPRQVIKLIIWINDHSGTLSKVCPGWGSEQLHAKSQAKQG